MLIVNDHLNAKKTPSKALIAYALREARLPVTVYCYNVIQCIKMMHSPFLGRCKKVDKSDIAHDSCNNELSRPGA